MRTLTSSDLLDLHDTILLDAYGVLVHHGGVLEHATDFIHMLHDRHKPYYVLTNDASHLAENLARRFAGWGLPIEAERIITSGSLLVDHFAKNNLKGAACVVLGPSDSITYVERAGGIPVEVSADAAADVLVVCDDAGFPFLETLEAAMTLVLRRIDAHKPLHLILCNPDTIYPKGAGVYGFTSGSMALLIETAIQTRYPHLHGQWPCFVRLGKPHRPMFDAVYQRTQTYDMVLIGDQILTDIRGAQDFGIPSALVSTGLTSWPFDQAALDPMPTYLLASL